MNKALSTTGLAPSSRIDLRSSELENLLAQIAEGESERERERVLPFEAIVLIRRARLGALRLPTSAGGAGSTIRELFEVIIRLGEADANVAHILRNHFSVVERLVRDQRHPAAGQGLLLRHPLGRCEATRGVTRQREDTDGQSGLPSRQ
jgi:hypothetical protein